MTKGRRLAIIGFCIFLGFMAVCTVVAKGIYTSGLPQVSAQKPTSGSVAHEVKVTGTVRQGQEYGIYVASGLRVASISVRNGDVFEAGDPLFQIDRDDLQDIIEEKELALMKLNSQQKENTQNTGQLKRDRQTQIARAKEDYEKIAEEADIAIQRSQQALEAAQEELRAYEQYLSNTADSVSQGDSSQQFNRQEQLNQLKQTVTACEQALQDAKRQKDANLLAAGRAVEDAESRSTYSSAGEINALEIQYQQRKIEELKALQEQEGWVYAMVSGRVIDSRIAVGERTQDGASLLYALDSGERVIEAVFTREQAGYLSIGAQFSMKVQLPDGSSIRDDVILEYMEETENGQVVGEMPYANAEVVIGQTAELSYKKQSDTYTVCINKAALYQDIQGTYYVFVVEEQNGILGEEWKVRKVTVTILDQNDNIAAIENAELTEESRIVTSTSKELEEGDTVRLLE